MDTILVILNLQPNLPNLQQLNLQILHTPEKLVDHILTSAAIKHFIHLISFRKNVRKLLQGKQLPGMKNLTQPADILVITF